MKSLIICLFAAILSVTAIPGARAALDDFNGDWENADRNTRGITKLQIAVRGANVKVHAWGSCTAQDCDWGAVQGAPYSSSVDEDMARRTRAITAIFSPSHARTILVITQAGRNKIKVDAYTQFKSGGRNSYVQTYTMAKARPVAQVPVQPTPQPVQPLPQPVQVREDCISFDNRQAAVRQAQGRWKVAAGNMWLLDFAGNKAQADQALRVIKKYRMNKQCFVGRPNPPMQYFLSGNNAPSGGMQGEDCNAFNLSNTQVKKVQGRWKIVDGSHWLLDFEGNQGEARQAHAIMNKYGFSRICFVGRPNPPMTYFRR